MKYGINLLLWTSAVDESHAALLDQIPQWGYHGVELPVFAFEEANYANVGRRLDGLGLERTAVTVCTEAENPIAADASVRKAGIDRLRRALDMCAVAGCDCSADRCIPPWASSPEGDRRPTNGGGGSNR